MGLLRRPRLSLTGAVFRTVNENVIFTVDATAIPPIYNQDDRQLVKGVTGGVAGQITERWEVLVNVGYLDATLDTQNAVNNGNRLVLTPKFSGSVWSTYRLPRNLTARRRRPVHRRRVHQRGQHHQVAGVHAAWTAWWSTR